MLNFLIISSTNDLRWNLNKKFLKNFVSHPLNVHHGLNPSFPVEKVIDSFVGDQLSDKQFKLFQNLEIATSFTDYTLHKKWIDVIYIYKYIFRNRKYIFTGMFQKFCLFVRHKRISSEEKRNS